MFLKTSSAILATSETILKVFTKIYDGRTYPSQKPVSKFCAADRLSAKSPVKPVLSTEVSSPINNYFDLNPIHQKIFECKDRLAN